MRSSVATLWLEVLRHLKGILAAFDRYVRTEMGGSPAPPDDLSRR